MGFWRHKRSPGQLKHLCLSALLLSALFCPAKHAFASEPIVVLVGGTLIDGTGKTSIPDSVVVIRGSKITRVGRRATIRYPASAKVVDLTGKFLLPGLIDMHVHYHDWMGELFLAHGVTTVKDLGNVVEWISAVSADVEQGKMRGPRIFYVGNGLDAPPPARETHVGIESPEMGKRAVRLLHRKGATGIKLREKMTPELIRAIVEEAHKLGIPVTGHIRQTNAFEAARAGIDGLEHASGIVQAIGNRPNEPDQDPLQTLIADLKAFAKLEEAKIDELVKVLASRKVALVPSMAGWWRMGTERRDEFAREDAEYAKNPALAYVPADVRNMWATSAIYNLKNPDDVAQIKLGLNKLQSILLRHHRAGGKVLAASDTFNFVPGLSLQRELILLVDAGFTPLEAITIGTRDNAQFLGQGSQLGTIEPGKRADVLVVSSNPLSDIRNINKVFLVMKAGQLIDTSYHSDYAIPTPKPKITRPVWLEKELLEEKGRKP